MTALADVSALYAHERRHPGTVYTDAEGSTFTVGSDAPWTARARVETWRGRPAGYGMAADWMSYPVTA